ncbi:myb-related protein Zm38 [Panicum miliaceum]|uniref:Myb-related protein Zm38 n=1 Tax=Panicum miliaceum TaxID=4540 RepID=A0A3L6RKL3_PANMI|nr:myb-related protein Zm38 [Panicum miliaceum]
MEMQYGREESCTAASDAAALGHHLQTPFSAAEHQLDAIISQSLALPPKLGAGQDSPPALLPPHCPFFMFDTSVSPPSSLTLPVAQQLQHPFLTFTAAAMDAPSFQLPPLVDGMGMGMTTMDCGLGEERGHDHEGGNNGQAAGMANGGCCCYGQQQKQQQQEEQLGQDQWDDESAQHLLMWDDDQELTPSNLEAMESSAHSLLFMGPNDHA